LLIVEAMADEFSRRGVECVFGIPGKELVRLGVELRERGIQFHAVRHETQGIMMADGYWRATGRIGVAVLAQGAGFANAVGGLACAARARSGIVAISGDLLMSTAGTDPKALAIRRLKARASSLPAFVRVPRRPS
jgi:acetolactate synthase I/II/III large subunit